MRWFVLASIIFTLFVFLYRIRYRLANVFLTFAIIRKLTVSIGMKIPFLKEKIIGDLFSQPKSI